MRPASRRPIVPAPHSIRRDIMVAAPLENDPTGYSQFALRFYGGAAPDDLASFSQDALAGITRLFWNALKERRPGQPFLRVFDPAPERDGFTAPSTFVVTINDDKPFLVDSILSELA